MTGEPINISNIEKVQEGYENVAEKVKTPTLTNTGKGKSTTSGFFDTLGHILLTLFKVFVKFLGIIVIIVSLSVLVGLIIWLLPQGL